MRREPRRDRPSLSRPVGIAIDPGLVSVEAEGPTDDSSAVLSGGTYGPALAARSDQLSSCVSTLAATEGRRRAEHHHFPRTAAAEIGEGGLAKWFGRNLKKTQ